MTLICCGLTQVALGAAAAGEEKEEITAKSLTELLKLVRDGKISNQKANRRREDKFNRDKAGQQREVTKAEQRQREEEAESDRLEAIFNENEQQIAILQEQLSNRLGSLRELFGVLQQVSGDTRGVFDNSVISAEYPGRGDWLGEFAADMGKSTKLASIDEIERLWFELQREMTESAKISRFKATVIEKGGEQTEMEVIRVGTFNVVTEDGYLKYDTEKGFLAELPRQPADRFTDTTDDLADEDAGEFVRFGLDPTKGQLLGMLIQSPTLEERIQQGGTVGYVIIVLGIIGLLLSVERFLTLNRVAGKVRTQVRSEIPDEANPLGRVLQVYHDNKGIDAETLQLKLDEAILKEQPAINARIAFIKIISMVAPLLGLLGTVTGMILTFQAITLFGAGDPKMMAGGISQALMTTVMGLCVAIPTVLLHSIVQSRSNGIMHILTEQSAGLVAEHADTAGSRKRVKAAG